jgi:purine-binding chemotaxis protein CheW
MDGELLTFRLEDALLGVDVGAVQEVLSGVLLTAVPRSPVSVAGLVNLRGRVVLALDLRALMGRPHRGPEEAKASVILGSRGLRVCLVVDRIGDVVRVADCQFEPPPQTLGAPARHLVRGAYTLEHDLLLALDVDSLLEVTSFRAAAAPLAQVAPSSERPWDPPLPAPSGWTVASC